MEEDKLFQQIVALTKPDAQRSRTFGLYEVKFLCLDAMQFMLDAAREGKSADPKEFWKLKGLE